MWSLSGSIQYPGNPSVPCRAERRAGGGPVAVRVPAGLDRQPDRAGVVAVPPQQGCGDGGGVVDGVYEAVVPELRLEAVAGALPVEPRPMELEHEPQRFREPRAGWHERETGGTAEGMSGATKQVAIRPATHIAPKMPFSVWERLAS